MNTLSIVNRTFMALSESHTAWWNQVRVWRGGFLRRHDRLILNASDYADTGGKIPDSTQRSRFPGRARVRVAIDLDLILEAHRTDPNVWEGQGMGTCRSVGTSEKVSITQAITLRIEGGTYRLDFGRDLAPIDAVDPELKSSSFPYDERWVDWLFIDDSVAFSAPTQRLPLFEAIDMSTLHNSTWTSVRTDPIAEVHWHQEQWCLAPDGYHGVLPRPETTGLYHPTGAYPLTVSSGPAKSAPPQSGPSGSSQPILGESKVLSSLRKKFTKALERGLIVRLNGSKMDNIEGLWQKLIDMKALENKELRWYFDEARVLDRAIADCELHESPHFHLLVSLDIDTRRSTVVLEMQ